MDKRLIYKGFGKTKFFADCYIRIYRILVTLREHFVLVVLLAGRVPFLLGDKTTFINIYNYLYYKNMSSKNITLKVKSGLYGNYRAYCKKKGLIVSRQFEILMEKELEENGK